MEVIHMAKASAWRLFSATMLLARRMVEYYEQELKPFGLGVTDLRLLLAIQERPGVSQTVLAAEVALSQVVVSVRLQRLEAMALIERPHVGRRNVSVTLTSKGERLLHEVMDSLSDTPLLGFARHCPTGIYKRILKLLNHALDSVHLPKPRSDLGEIYPMERG